MRVRSSKMRVFSLDRHSFRMKFPTGLSKFTQHGFARFPVDSTALVNRCNTTSSEANHKLILLTLAPRQKLFLHLASEHLNKREPII